MADARGEKMVTSVPRSRCSFSCAFSRLSRISSSLMRGSAGGVPPAPFHAASCASRNVCSAAGAVV